MRTYVLMLAMALLIASGAATAQTPQTPSPTPQPSGQTPPQPQAMAGTIDVGVLLTTTDGDEARYERYRDTRDGLYSNFSLHRDDASYRFDGSAFHVGYRDQRYDATFLGRRVDLGFQWISLPLNYSYIAQTPFSRDGDGGTLTLPDSAQQAVQGPTNSASDGTAVGVPCAPGAPPGTCNNPTQAGQAKANRSIYNSLTETFELRHVRDTATVGANIVATHAIDIDARFISSGRDGEQPWGASYAFNTGVELPAPIDQRTNDLRLGASWTGSNAMFRIGWDGSWFNNNVQTLVWDNPIRITDFNNGLVPPNGPYDPSGYSNGNGAAQGREALAPSNSMNVVSATAFYRLPRRTTLNGTLQFTSQNQDEQLIPFTINNVINNTSSVIAAFPHLATLPRPTAEAEAKGVNTLINLSSRPARRVSVVVRYRYNRRDVRTPIFDATEYVRFDAVPEEIEEGFSPQFDNSRNIFDAYAAFTPSGWGTVRVGYGFEGIDRAGRGFSNTDENTFRASYDAYSNQFVTVRGNFDYGRRRGEGFVEAASGDDEGPGGTQPTLRYYDEADRNRTRGSVIVTAFPRETVDVFFQFTGTKDEYLADDSVPVSRAGELFGLHDQSITSWSLGANFHPTEIVAVGASYGRDHFSSFQMSRNATPPPDPTWTDPSRDWTLDNDDNINTFILSLELQRAVRNTDIHFSYDYSDSDNAFVHGGPRIASLSSAGQFIPLPNVENSWHRANADVQYFFSERAGVGVGYYFEKLDVQDFNTVDTDGPVGFAPETGDPRIDWLGGLITGYGNRPYTGNTVYVRLLYRF